MIFFQKISYIASIWRPSKFAVRGTCPPAPPRYATDKPADESLYDGAPQAPPNNLVSK